MTVGTFYSRQDVAVILHDEAGNDIATVHFVRGAWIAPDEVQAGAMRRALPTLAEYAVREGEKPDTKPLIPTRTRKATHQAGTVGARTHARHEEATPDETQ